MLEVKALPFVKATDLISQICIYRYDKNANGLHPETRSVFLEILGELKEQLQAIGASRPTMSSIERTLVYVGDENCSLEIMGSKLEELRGRLFDDLGEEFLLSLNRNEKAMYEATSPWGRQLALQFPSLQDEVRESSKCLALCRYTASAFHSLRCLEAGVISLSRCLQIADPTKGHDRNWSAMLRKIDESRKQRWNATAIMAGDGQIFDELYAALASMQNPWRNATMHLEHSFDKEQSLHVFAIVGNFMRRVAERMDERGLPFA